MRKKGGKSKRMMEMERRREKRMGRRKGERKVKRKGIT